MSIEVAFVSLVMESLPFLLVGALLSTALAGPVGRRLVGVAARHPRRAAALAPFTGITLPLCDCGIVPLARSLRAGGVAPAAVNGFVAGAPLTNPIVILSTLVAFPGQPMVVAGRIAVGVAAAMVAAAIGPRAIGSFGSTAACSVDHHDEAPTPVSRPARQGLAAVSHELASTGPWLVAGAALAATFKAFVPDSAFAAVAAQPLLAAAAMMLLAFVLSICSQADAFVAASLPVGPLPRLAFLVMGPMCDLKLSLLYRREFGIRWAVGYVAVVVPAVLVLVTVWTTWVSP